MNGPPEILKPSMGLSAANILRVIRDGNATDWDGLRRALHIDPSEFSRRSPYLMALRRVFRLLEELREANLIAFTYSNGANWRNAESYVVRQYEPIEGQIAVTPYWHKVQAALDISLTKVASISDPSSLVVWPFFGAPRETETSVDIFVLMPFTDELKAIYDTHIRRVAEPLNLRIGRADDLFTTHSVMWDVWNSIHSSSIIIADCTGRNPNVFYELGIAHTLGKPVILITQDADDIPFDIRHIRYIPYEYTPPGMQEFEEHLSRTLRGLLGS